jgi:RNA polymerase sigma-70 factor (ECF subfamily)
MAGEVASASAGAFDPVAMPLFEEFFEAQQAGLYGALRLITGNGHDAEELTQESFLRVWERWDRVARMENPTGYLYRTAMNAFRMRRRRALTAARRLIGQRPHQDDFAAAEARREIDRGLARLTPRQRAAVVLTELLQFSSAEAAETLRTTPANVRKLASQGREILRKTIGVDDG